MKKCDGEQPISEVQIISMPSDTGDLLYFKTESGEIVGQNTMSSNFDGIIKTTE
jgi:hypothetical protein